MLNRAMSSPTWTPSRWTNWRRTLSRKDTASLLRYVLVVAVLCLVGCLYLWQVNDIKNISNDTVDLRVEASALEAVNVSLMQQLAQWQSPAYIEQRGGALGLAPAGEPLRVKVPATGAEQLGVSAASGAQQLADAGSAETTR